MKTIMLMRHAQSSHGTGNQKDFDRPLAEQGSIDASRMGLFIRKVAVQPAYIEGSTAKRAQETIELIIKAADLTSDMVTWNEDLYYGGARDYLSAVQNASDDTDRIMIVGHNPLLEETVSLLCNGEGEYVARIPSGGLVCIEHPAIKWKQIKPGTARFRWMMVPELLQKMD
ncbi:SixA phosphatase family protein [Fodinibius sp.]|uniref:SixA phosphatase family protein n=1 Tax=Fodinibius sp. TaxID=1872440 RepID=UPI002ACE7E00|nr:histidine phosphatase family protein [Fodinibius sp.]MDZ7659991.1 histidine phosphatase family protein [Fodinibius sp.]